MKELNELVAIAERADAYGNLMNANPHKILAIDEAFRALEQRAEAAEVALCKQRAEVDKANALIDDLREERDLLQRLAATRAVGLEAAEAKLYRQESIIPEGLTRCTAELVMDFAKALAEKLYRSEQKYGWSDGWKESDWQDKCLADFHRHISKGDPRDVAAYCAFMWHHEWPTRPAPAVSLSELVPDVEKWRPAEQVWAQMAYRTLILRNIEQANER